jgi:hypothetical protein
MKTVPGFKEAALPDHQRGGPLSPAAVLRELLHSNSESTRLKAAVALSRIPPEPPDPDPNMVIVYAPPIDAS